MAKQHVYIIQFEMTEAFSSAKKAAEHLLKYYKAIDWYFDAYEDEMSGRDVETATVAEIVALFKRRSFFHMQARGSNDYVRISKVELI